MDKHQTKNSTYKKGFTLVELIIVITILAILSVIAFISFQSYSWNARDGNRLATLKNIENGLELFMTKVGTYPEPEWSVSEWVIDGNTYITKWEIGESIITQIQMNTIPIDPETKNNYIYAITSWKNEYQLATISESQLTYQPFISQTYAKTYQAKVEWNYKWFLKYQSGSTQEGCVSYINIPSLIWNNHGEVDLLETENTQTVPYYIVNQWENLPYHPNNELWNIKPNNIIQFLRKNASAHLVTVCEEVLKELSEKSWTLDQNDEEILISFWAENPQNLKDKILPSSPILTVTYKSCDDIKHLESKTFWKT